MSRRASRSLATAICALAALVGAAFALQVSILGRPGREPLLVVGAVKRLVAYHASSAEETVAGRRLAASCNQRWLRRGHLAVVSLSDGPTLSELAGRLLAGGNLARAEFDLAGCPHPLAKWLGFELSSGAPLRVRPARLDGRRVLALVFPAAHPSLDVYVSVHGGLPLGLSVDDAGLQGTSLLVYGRARGHAPGGELTGTAGR